MLPQIGLGSLMPYALCKGHVYLTRGYGIGVGSGVAYFMGSSPRLGQPAGVAWYERRNQRSKVRRDSVENRLVGALHLQKHMTLPKISCHKNTIGSKRP